MSGQNIQGSTVTEETLRSLIRAYGLVRRVLEPYFTQFGIRGGSQWGTLRALHRARAEGAASLRVSELGTRLLVRPPSVTGVLYRLERMDLVARSASPTDMRVTQVSLTPKGLKLVDQVLVGLPAKVQSMLGKLDGQEQRELHGLLCRLAAHLEPLAEQEEKRNRA